MASEPLLYDPSKPGSVDQVEGLLFAGEHGKDPTASRSHELQGLLPRQIGLPEQSGREVDQESQPAHLSLFPVQFLAFIHKNIILDCVWKNKKRLTEAACRSIGFSLFRGIHMSDI